MEYRSLGDDALEISAILLGTAFRGRLVEEMPRVIARALDLGINTFDTGGYVRNGVVTEEVLGKAIAGRRQERRSQDGAACGPGYRRAPPPSTDRLH